MEVVPEVRGYSISEGLVCQEPDPEERTPGPVDQPEHRSLGAQLALPRSDDNYVAEGETLKTPIMIRSLFLP